MYLELFCYARLAFASSPCGLNALSLAQVSRAACHLMLFHLFSLFTSPFQSPLESPRDLSPKVAKGACFLLAAAGFILLYLTQVKFGQSLASPHFKFRSGFTMRALCSIITTSALVLFDT